VIIWQKGNWQIGLLFNRESAAEGQSTEFHTRKADGAFGEVFVELDPHGESVMAGTGMSSRAAAAAKAIAARTC
jgi:hypothetical protein